MSRAPVFVSVLSLSLAGCASYSGLQGEARPLAPQSLAFHAEDPAGTWPREDWWSAFGDPKLNALVQQALAGNPSLRAAEARVRTVTALADAAQARLVLASAVAQSYFQTQTDLAALALARQTLAQRDSLLELNRLRASRGLEAAIAVRQSDQQIASSRVDLSAAEAAVELDRHQLGALLGAGPDVALGIEPALRPYSDALALPANLPADLIARRPDLAAQRFRVEAAAAQIGVAKADFLPNVNLTAFAGFGATSPGGL